VLATSPRWLIWFQFSLSTDFSASVEAPAAGLRVVAHPTFPGLSSQEPPAVFSPVQQSFGQVFIFVAGNFIDAQVLVRASMPASFHHSAQRQRQLVFRSSSTPRVNTSVFASCVSPPPAAARLGCQFQAAACPGSPARWSCCTVGCRSSALIWFTGSVLLDCRVRHHQFAST
jgi:hypothetical protein